MIGSPREMNSQKSPERGSGRCTLRKSVQPPLFIRRLISNLNSVHPYAPRTAANVYPCRTPSPSAVRLCLLSLPSAAAQHSLSLSFSSPTGVKSLEIDLLSALLAGRGFVCFNSTARDSIIRRVITGEFAAWRCPNYR